MNKPFTLSIEPTNGKAFQHGFHLGTDERVARQLAVEKFNARNANGRPTRTVALLREGKLFDVFDGTWTSQYVQALYPDFDLEEMAAKLSLERDIPFAEALKLVGHPAAHD